MYMCCRPTLCQVMHSSATSTADAHPNTAFPRSVSIFYGAAPRSPFSHGVDGPAEPHTLPSLSFSRAARTAVGVRHEEIASVIPALPRSLFAAPARRGAPRPCIMQWITISTRCGRPDVVNGQLQLEQVPGAKGWTVRKGVCIPRLCHAAGHASKVRAEGGVQTSAPHVSPYFMRSTHPQPCAGAASSLYLMCIIHMLRPCRPSDRGCTSTLSMCS